MSNYSSFRLLSIFFVLFCCVHAQKTSAQYDDSYVSYDDFYESLAPYGVWIEDPQYGYVWSPTEDASFRPYYTAGHWAMTEYGNTWVSDYRWGWACFHYGRWTFDNYYGWLWIPGDNWGPAWVSWRAGDGFYGWAPLGPGYQFGSTYNDYNCPSDWWVFIPPQYVYTGNYYHYWNGPRGNTRIINNTTYINNTYVTNNVTYVSGPHATQVQQVTGQSPQIFHIRSASTNRNTRVHNNDIRMYRPATIRPTRQNTGERPIPSNVVTAPQPVRSGQAVNTSQSTITPFRSTLRDNSRPATPGTNVSETAKPSAPRQNNATRPYEWDVNRSVPQEQPVRQPARQQESQPQRQQPQRQPQQQPQRQAPQQSQPQRQQPQPAPAKTTKPAQDQNQQQQGRRR